MVESQSAGGVVLNPHGEILIVNQKGRSWSLPKGHVEAEKDIDENGVIDFLETAKREIFEETGLTELEYIAPLDPYSRFAMGRDNKDNGQEFKTLNFFLFKTQQMELSPKDKDNPEARWVKKEEVADYLTHPEDKKFIESVLKTL